jgi:hypothetical protein
LATARGYQGKCSIDEKTLKKEDLSAHELFFFCFSAFFCLFVIKNLNAPTKTLEKTRGPGPLFASLFEQNQKPKGELYDAKESCA